MQREATLHILLERCLISNIRKSFSIGKFKNNMFYDNGLSSLKIHIVKMYNDWIRAIIAQSWILEKISNAMLSFDHLCGVFRAPFLGMNRVSSRASAEKFPGGGQRKKQDRNIAQLSLSLFYQYHVWKSKGATALLPPLPTPMSIITTTTPQ